MGAKNYETPPEFFRARWELHRFNVDAFASDHNALVRPHDDGCLYPCEEAERAWCDLMEAPIGRYYTEETDGLNGNHYEPGDRVWANPPYDYTIVQAVPLFRLLAMECGVTSELLLPASTDTKWFLTHLWNDEAGHWRDGVEGHFIGRVQFLLDGQPIRDAKGKVVSSRQANLLITLKARVL